MCKLTRKIHIYKGPGSSRELCKNFSVYIVVIKSINKNSDVFRSASLSALR